MEDVTDTALRELLLTTADPSSLHVVMTEFASTDGLVHKKARKRIIHRLHVTCEERALLKKKNVKIVAQIWGNKPENYTQVIKEIFDEMKLIMQDGMGMDLHMMMYLDLSLMTVKT